MYYGMRECRVPTADVCSRKLSNANSVMQDPGFVNSDYAYMEVPLDLGVIIIFRAPWLSILSMSRRAPPIIGDLHLHSTCRFSTLQATYPASASADASIMLQLLASGCCAIEPLRSKPNVPTVIVKGESLQLCCLTTRCSRSIGRTVDDHCRHTEQMTPCKFEVISLCV